MRPRPRLLSALLLVFALLAAACGSAPPPAPLAAPAATAPQPAPAFPVTLTDDTGHSVTLDKPPQRIVSLSPGHTETLYALGLGDRVVATDRYSTYPPENKPKATLNTYPKPNLEELVALKPDLIVVLVEGDDFIRQMQSYGIPVLKLFPTTVDGALRDIDLLGRATGAAERARQLTAGLRQRLDAVQAKVKGLPAPTVLYELDASDATKPFVAGPHGFYGDVIPLAGGRNVFGDLPKDFAQVSAEQVIARDPQVIVLGDASSPYNSQTPEMVKARPGWSRIAAVRDGRIYTMDNALISSPGPRLVDGVEQLARLLHPQAFQ